MADLQIVMEVVGQKNIESASNNLQKLEGRVNKLTKALNNGRIDSQQFSTGLKEIRRSVD